MPNLARYLRGFGRRKPGPWADIDWSHPLARGLVDYLPLGADPGISLVPGSVQGIISGTSLSTNILSSGISRSVTATGEYITQGTAALPTTGSIVLWIKPTVAYNDGSDKLFFNVISNANNFIQVRIFTDSNFYCGWFVAGVDYRVATSASGLTTTAHHLLVLTWTNGGATKLYLDGSQIGATVNGTATISTAGLTRYIGNIAPPNPTTRPAKALLSEYGIYNRSLSSTEVYWLYQEPFAFLQQPAPKRAFSFTKAVPPVTGKFQPAWARRSPVIGVGVY